MDFSNQPKWKRELAATRAGLRRIDDDKDKPVLQRSVGEDETDKAVTRSEAAMLENNDDSSSRKVLTIISYREACCDLLSVEGC
jgi:hypothetical protein